MRRRNLWLIGTALPLLLAFIWGGFSLDRLAESLPAAAVTSTRRLPIYSVQTTERKVAISFDAAWGADHTETLLDILDEYKVKTTFFLVTFWVEKYPEMARKIVARGHEIGMHSSTHPDFTALSAEQMRRELTQNHETIRQITGFNSKLFRPPFGAYDNRVIEVVEDELNFITIQWSVDSLDWKDVTADYIAQRVLGQIEPGDIVLFHNNAAATPAALPAILDRLQADDYEIVPVSKLILHDNYRINHEGKQVPMPPKP